MYGNRTPQGYKKLSLLGRGGCALVWLCEDQSPENKGRRVAVKQFPKNGGSNPNL